MTLSYQIIRSTRRKTLALQVKHGQVLVRAPHYVSEQDIDNVVQSKVQWLQSKLLMPQQTLPCQRCYEHGEALFIRGVEKKLSIHFSDGYRVTEFPTEIHIHLPHRFQNIQHLQQEKISAVIKKQLELWLKQQMESYLAVRLNELCQLTQLFPKSYKVRRYKARWGSCNNKKELSFNYLLMMTPDWVLDYVIIHELCHLKYLNHSALFWQLVEQFSPKFAVAKVWLKEHQQQLHW